MKHIAIDGNFVGEKVPLGAFRLLLSRLKLLIFLQSLYYIIPFMSCGLSWGFPLDQTLTRMEVIIRVLKMIIWLVEIALIKGRFDFYSRQDFDFFYQ